MTGPLAVFALGAFVSRPSPRYPCTDRDGRRQGESPTRQARSSVTVTKQCNAPARHYQRAPHWEIYLRTVTFSAEQSLTGTHRWLILSRCRPVYHSPVTEMLYSNSLLSRSSGQSCREQSKMQQGSWLNRGSRKQFMLRYIVKYFSPLVFSLLSVLWNFTCIILRSWLHSLLSICVNTCFCHPISPYHIADIAHLSKISDN